MVKSIFKRIIVAVSVALILMLLKGSLITNVSASEIYSIETSSGNNFASCTNCQTLTATGVGEGFGSYIKNKSGNLFLNVMLYSESDANSYVPTLTRVRLTAHNETYNCFISGYSNGYETNTFLQRLVQSYSAICPVSFDNNGGIQEIFVQTNGFGSGGISLYSPMTFVADSNQEIINSITENSQNEIESQKTCIKYDKSSIQTNGFLAYNGSVNSSDIWGISKYIRIDNTTTIENLEVLSSGAYGTETCFYNINKEVISCVANANVTQGSTLTIPQNSSFVRFSIQKTNNKPQWQVCKNGNQGIVDSTNDLNDTLNDNNVSSGTTSSIDNVFTFGTQEETFGPVADLLLLPLTLYRAFQTGFSGSCSTFSLGTLFGTELNLPCINLRNILGAQLYSFIDVAISLFMILNIILFCIDIFDRITSFEDPFNDLYSPKHTYHGRHENGGAYHG